MARADASMRSTPNQSEQRLPMSARVIAGLVLGLALGVVGLPRIDLPLPSLPFKNAPTARLVTPPDDTILIDALPTLTPVLVRPTPTLAPRPTPTATVPRVLFAQRFVTPIANWPDDHEGNSWFADGAYQLFARDSGRFVAVGVPLAEPVGDAVLTAQFHKVGGPNGGGYGFIVRDEGRTAERDGSSQGGRYLVLEVGDQGDVGIWQRAQTRWIDIVPWTRSDAVHTGREPNTLAVFLRGTTLSFEVNGEVVADVGYEGVPARGGVGIFVGGDLNEVALEWLRIETL